MTHNNILPIDINTLEHDEKAQHLLNEVRAPKEGEGEGENPINLSYALALAKNPNTNVHAKDAAKVSIYAWTMRNDHTDIARALTLRNDFLPAAADQAIADTVCLTSGSSDAYNIFEEAIDAREIKDDDYVTEGTGIFKRLQPQR